MTAYISYEKRQRVAASIILTIVWFLICTYLYSAAFGKVTRVNIRGKVAKDVGFQVFYTTKDQTGFNDTMIESTKARPSNDFQNIYFEINTTDIEKLRLDLGVYPGEIIIKDLTVEQAFKRIKLSPKDILNTFTNVSSDIDKIEIQDNLLHIYSSKIDPLMIWDNAGNILRSQPVDSLKLTIIFFASILLAFATIKTYSYLQKKEISPEKCVFVALFMLIITLPGIVNMLGIGTSENSEQRLLAEKPKFVLNRDTISAYPRAYEEYLDDNFGLKNFLVRLNSYIDVKLLKTSPIDKVTLGKEGWLYSTKEGSLNMLDIYRGMVFFTDEELAKIKKNLEERRDWLKSQGIPFVIMVAPNKESIYPEYLPDNIRKVNEKNRLDQLLTYLKENSDIKIIDIREELINKKNVGRLYYKTDSHWNELGAYFGSKRIIEEVNKYFPNVKPKELDQYQIVKETKAEGGDLAKMLSLKKDYSEEHILLKPKEKTFSVVNHPYVLNQGLVTENIDSTLPRMLMFRDSFTVNMQPFLSEYFSTAVYQWNHSFDPNLVLETKPNIVVHEIVERYIHELLAENPPSMKQ